MFRPLKSRQHAIRLRRCLTWLRFLLLFLFACYWCATSTRLTSREVAQRRAVLATARRKAQLYGVVTLLYLNAAYHTTTKSFICNLNAVNSTYINALLVITSSLHTARELEREFPQLSVHTTTFSKNQALGFNDFAYYQLIAERVSIQNMLIQSGLTVFMVESDAVWLAADVMQTIVTALKHHVVVSTDDFFNLQAEHQRTISAGFMAYKSTKRSRRVFNEYTKQYVSYIQVAALTGKNTAVEGEQILLTRILDKERVKVPREVDVTWLDGCEFVNGRWYTDLDYRSTCRRPKVIQNNWIIGIEKKNARARREHHWFLNDDESSCTNFTHDIRFVDEP